MGSSKKVREQLGMSPGKASGILKKELLFYYVKKCGDNICYQCKKEIEKIGEFSIEHKIPFLHSDSPIELFFDLKNIAFSHIKCNCKAARVRKSIHPSSRCYRNGCRCDECREINRDSQRRKREKKK